MNNEEMPLDFQAATALSALFSALCKQPGFGGDVEYYWGKKGPLTRAENSRFD